MSRELFPDEWLPESRRPDEHVLGEHVLGDQLASEPSPGSQVPGDPLSDAASSLRRGVVRLGQRLRAERPGSSEPLLRLGVLAHLNRRGPMTPGELAALERLQPQSLTRTLTALEHDQLVIRRADPADRRRALLAITETGHGVLRADMRERDAWLTRAMADTLTPTEREVLRLAGDLMERLAESAAPRPA
jgi:DNA-binding MarR family transcriptional regulator